MDELKKYLETLAEKKDPSDNEDFNAMDYSGGNYDDAFSMGQNSGEIQLARGLLAKFFS